MEKRKLIAFDIDGTVLNSQHKVLDSTLEVVAKLKKDGHLVMLATGRSLPTATGVIKELGLSDYVLCNGAYAFINHQQVYSNPIDKEELKSLITLANRERIDLLYQTLTEVKQQGTFIHEKNRRMQEVFNAQSPSQEFDVDQEEAIYQAILFCDRQEARLFENRFSKVRFTRWGEDAMDVVPVDGSKAATLERIAKEHKITVENIIVFGDGENDIEMLRYAGLGIAMDNASDVVKKHADFITRSNDDHGIWHAAKHHELV